MSNILNVKEGIFLLKYLSDSTLAVIDQRSTVRIIDTKSFKVLDGFKSKQVHEHRILNIVGISLSGKYTLIGLPHKNKAALFLTQEKKLKSLFGEHNGDVETVAISDDEQYFATGGTDGRTFVYHLLSKIPFIVLPPRSDYISCIGFSEDSSIVAFGSFDRTITIKNIALMSDDFNLKGHNAPIKKIHFLSSQHLLSVDRDGSIILWDLYKRVIKIRLPKMLEEILDMTVSKDKHFLFVSTIYGNIGLYDLEKLERISGSYLKTKDRVNALAIDDQKKLLFYGTQEGDVMSHSLLSGDEDLLEAMTNRDFKSAYKKIEDNVLLSFSPHYDQLEELWKTALSQAKQLFGKGLHEAGVKVLNPFSEVPGKRGMINKVINEFTEFKKFKTLVSERKYALAYPLAIKHPMYQESQEYIDMETIWETQFFKAKKAILAQAGEEKAREHLTLFRGVSHKAKLITALYNQRKVFMLFRHKLVQKDFMVVFQLLETYPFLAEFKEFKELKTWGDTLYIKIQKAYETQDYLRAIKYAQMIKDFPEFKEEVQTLVDYSHVYIAFKQATESHDLNKIYDLLEENSFLANLPGLKGVDFQWDDILNKIDEPISEGNMQEVLYLLKPYPHAKYKKRHIVNFIKTTYMRQLEMAIETKEPAERIVQGFKNMYALFGKDELLTLVSKNYEQTHKLEVDFSHTKAGNVLMFNMNNLKMSILPQ